MRDFIRRFCKDEEGVVAIELLLMTPILVWALLSTFVYFDAFRVESVSNRAALTIADMLSREADSITPPYLNGTHSLLRTLTFEEANPDFRVTVYTFDKDDGPDGRYIGIWSQHRGYDAAIASNDVNALRARLPILADNDRAILVETRTEYSAPIRIGMGLFKGLDLQDITFNTFTVIRPREDQICWDADAVDDFNPLVC